VNREIYIYVVFSNKEKKANGNYMQTRKNKKEKIERRKWRKSSPGNWGKLEALGAL
jgi:hypothetical protein